MKTYPYKKLTSYMLSFALVAAMLACSKDSDDPIPGTKNEVEGSWKLSVITVDPAQSGITDLLAYLEAQIGNKCISGTTFDFLSNGTIDGTVPAGCNAMDNLGRVPDENTTWKVVGNKIQLTEDTDVTEYDLAVNKTEMKWSYVEVDDAVSYKITLVFKKP